MPLESGQVLVIDDDPVIRRLIVTVSRQAGYHTSEASDGARALAMIEKGSFALLVLDLMLPSLSGQELLERLDSRDDCQVILVTAADDGAVREIDSRLVCDIVRKPFDIHRLESAISRALESKTSEQRLHITRSATPEGDPAASSAKLSVSVDEPDQEQTVPEELEQGAE